MFFTSELDDSIFHSNGSTAMPKTTKPKKNSAVKMAGALDQMAAVYALGTVGTVSLTDARLMCHRLSSACHARIGLEGQREATLGEMLLMLVHVAGLHGMTAQQMVEQAALEADRYEHDAALAMAASELLTAEAAAGI